MTLRDKKSNQLFDTLDQKKNLDCQKANCFPLQNLIVMLHRMEVTRIILIGEVRCRHL